MIVVDSKETKKILNMLYNYKTETRTEKELQAIENMKKFFEENNKPRHLEFLQLYFEENHKLEKDYTRSGQMYLVCTFKIGYDTSHGYKLREDIVNRMAIELLKV
jgi:alcohol dehydrogenase YqhD (iron-dependent ADH family)